MRHGWQVCSVSTGSVPKASFDPGVSKYEQPADSNPHHQPCTQSLLSVLLTCQLDFVRTVEVSVCNPHDLS